VVVVVTMIIGDGDVVVVGETLRQQHVANISLWWQAGVALISVLFVKRTAPC
jgi:hypothetical protein